MKSIIWFFSLFHLTFVHAQISVFTEDFDDNRNFWREIDNDSISAKIENGVYSLESNSTKPLFFWNSNLPIDYEKDFRIEFKIPTSDLIKQNFDFIYAGLDAENYFCIHLVGGVKASHFWRINGEERQQESPFFIEVPLPHFKDSVSCVTIDKRGESLFLFVNNDFVTVFNSQINKGSKIGLLLPNQSNFKINSIQIFQPEPQHWLSENMVKWNYPKSNLESTRKRKVYINYEVKSSVRGIADQLFFNNERSEVNNLKLKRGLNYVKLQLSDSLNHSLSIDKIIRKGKGKTSKSSKAILFANDTFDEWENLNNPKNDVDSLKKTLEFIYGYEVEIIYNTTKQELIENLERIPTENINQLLYYFAGHGALDSLENAYWVCTDSRLKDKTGESYLSWKAIIEALDSIQVEQKLLITDVCFSGKIEGVTKSSTVGCTNQIFIASGSEIVSDGVPSANSPFALDFIDFLSLNSYKMLKLDRFTLQSTFYFKPEVKFGNFGNACNQGNYIFVPK